jgi:hypothetical protein
MSKKKVTINKKIAEKWNEVNALFREVKQARDDLKAMILRAIYEENKGGVVWVDSYQRVRAVESRSRRFSMTDLRNKFGRERLEAHREELVKQHGEEWLENHELSLIDDYGDEWIAENSNEATSVTVEVKHMKRRR